MSLHKTGLAMTYRVISVYVVGGTLTKCKKCIESLSGSKIASAGQHEAHKQHFRAVSYSGSVNTDVSELCKSLHLIVHSRSLLWP